MATRMYGLNPSQPLENVVENVGSAASSAFIVLTVDLSTSAITEGSTTRGILKSEVILVMETLVQYIIRGNWPPA